MTEPSGASNADAPALPSPPASEAVAVVTPQGSGESTGLRRLPTPSLGGLGYKPKRVRLKSLILDNFKSFANRTQIELLEGFTAISGPNGSGKSNLIDAVLFVLGFASSKGLRADRLTDLINSDSGKPAARVTLQLEVVTDKDEIKIVEVSRVVRRVRGTESQAHYELDGQNVRMHDLHDVLQDLGLPSGGYNVVVQNDVTRVTGMGEVERRKILDEIAGAQEFDRRIGGANRELEEAARHEGETRVVLKEIETRLATLETQKEQALAYQALQVEKDRAEAELFVLDVLEALHKAAKKREEVENRAERVANFEEDLVEANAESAKADAALAAVDAELKAKGEGERLAAVKEVEGLKANAANVRAKADEARREAEGIRSKDADRDTALQAALGREQELSRREADRRKQLEELEGQHSTLRVQVDAAQSQFQARAKGALDVAEQQRALHQQVEAHRLRETQLSNGLRSLAERTVRASTERDSLVQALDADRTRRREVETLSAEAQSERRIAREDYAREEARLANLIARQKQLRAGVEKLDADLSHVGTDLTRIDERRKAFVEQSGGRAMEAIRREGLEGVHGAVHELFKFQGDHALAIEAAAGGRLSWVVVEDEFVGKRAIELLKRQNAGRLTFSPLSKIRPPQVQLRPVRGRGVVGYAFELVDFDPVYENVFKLVLSDTLIVEDMESAIALGISSYRMVTLDGELLDRNGTMTGGWNQRGGGNVLAAAARFDQELAQKQSALDELRRRRDAARAELDKVEREGQVASQAFSGFQVKLAEATQKVDSQNGELQRLEARIGPAEARLAQLDAELARARAESAAAEAQLEELRRTISGADLELRVLPAAGTSSFEDFAQKHAALEQTMRELEKSMDDVREELEAVKLERQKAVADVEACRAAIETARATSASADERTAAAAVEADRLEADLAKKEKLVAELMEELEELTSRLTEARALSQDARDQAKETARLLEVEKQARAAAEVALAELDADAKAKKAQADERKIVLPALVEPKQDSAEEKKPRRRRKSLSGEAAALAAESSAIARAELEAAQAEVQAQAAPSGPPPVNPLELPKLRDQGRRELARLEGKMKALEPVNMLAIAEHAEFSKRKAELDEKLATLDREMTAIRTKIVELEGAKKTTFLEAFDAVASAFEENFHELFKGEGRLELEDRSNPFGGGMAIIARPDGQKARRLEALSGGQKTLTALAFLFALQKVTPAPFFVLDEVDASLDGANTAKLADAIRRRGAERQYFVVSHRRALVEKAQRAIGVTRRPNFGTQVAGITLDEVSMFEAEADAQRRAAQKQAQSSGSVGGAVGAGAAAAATPKGLSPARRGESRN